MFTGNYPCLLNYQKTRIQFPFSLNYLHNSWIYPCPLSYSVIPIHSPPYQTISMFTWISPCPLSYLVIPIHSPPYLTISNIHVYLDLTPSPELSMDSYTLSSSPTYIYPILPGSTGLSPELSIDSYRLSTLPTLSTPVSWAVYRLRYTLAPSTYIHVNLEMPLYPELSTNSDTLLLLSNLYPLSIFTWIYPCPLSYP